MFKIRERNSKEKKSISCNPGEPGCFKDFPPNYRTEKNPKQILGKPDIPENNLANLTTEKNELEEINENLKELDWGIIDDAWKLTFKPRKNSKPITIKLNP